MYKIVIKKRAKKFIDALPRTEKQRLVSEIEKLPNCDDVKPLKGHEKDGLMRLRVGKYRVIYNIDNGKLTIYVIDADSRGQIYKRYYSKRH